MQNIITVLALILLSPVILVRLIFFAIETGWEIGDVFVDAFQKWFKGL